MIMQKVPVIILNYKTYVESAGLKGRVLTRMTHEVMREKGVRMVVCPQTPDLYLHRDSGIEVFAQHVDPIEPGSHTGHVLPLALVEAGVSGSLINHSEDRMPSNKISMCVALCRQHKLTSIVCAESIEKVKEVAVFKPDYIAIEPPELIGSGIPVSKADPDIVRNSVKAVQETIPRRSCFAAPASLKARTSRPRSSWAPAACCWPRASSRRRTRRRRCSTSCH